jgi:hypothetical protein
MSFSQYLSSVKELLGRFEPVSLKELDAVALQKRKDRKFVFHQEKLIPLLQALCPGYKVLEIDTIRIHKYLTTYFDTDKFQMYLDHHNEKLNRFKVRLRKYEATGNQFLEIKFKNNKRDTLKNRTLLKDHSLLLSSHQDGFISSNSPYQLKELNSVLNNSFFRMTFTDKSFTERLTIDTALEFSMEKQHIHLEKLVIAELKQASYSNAGFVIGVLRELGIQPQRVSKYCIGQALLNENIKINRFKPHLLTINKICNGTFDNDHA